MKWVIVCLGVVSLICPGIWGVTGTGWAQSEPAVPPAPPNAPPNPPAEQGPPGVESQPPVEQGPPEAMSPSGPGLISDLGGGEEELSMPLQELRLEPDQMQHIQQIQQDFLVKTASLRQEVQFVRLDFQAALVGESVDQAQIQKLVTQMVTVERQLREALVQQFGAIRKVLTPEQLDDLANRQLELPAEFGGLQVTAEQRAQIQKLMQEAQPELRAAGETVQGLRAELRELLLSSGAVDSEKVQQVQDQLDKARAAQETARGDLVVQIKEVLTPEQRQQLQQLQPAHPPREGGEPPPGSGK
jgi:Spy/CpxP family protein refolding chaperone